MRVVLVVAEGVHRGREVVVTGPRFIVGRDPDCQLRAKSAAVSKHHFEITFEGDGVWVTDLGSTNGTHVSGTLVRNEPVELFDGDRLQAGPLAFDVRIESAPKPTVMMTDDPTLPSSPPAPIPGDPRDSNLSTAGEDAEVERTAEWEAPESGPGMPAPDEESAGKPARPGRRLLPPAGPRTARIPRTPPQGKSLEGTAKAADDLLRRLQRGRKPFPPPG